MKDEELFKQLKAEFQTLQVPDLKHVIKARHINEQKHVEMPTKKLPWLSFPRLLASVLSIVMVVVIVVAFINSTPTIYASEAMTFQAITAISLVETEDDGTISYHPNTSSYVDELHFIPLELTPDEELDEINPFIPLVEQALSLQNDLTVTKKTSNQLRYRNYETIQSTSFLGQVRTYDFYYNVRQMRNGEMTLLGMMIYNGEQFAITSRRVVTEEGFETSLTVRSRDNYVSVKRNEAESEVNYQYQIYNRGVMKQANMTLETIDEEPSIRLQFIQNVLQSTYEFQKDETDDAAIIIRGRSGLFNTRVRVQESDDDEVYEYEDTESGNKQERPIPNPPKRPNRGRGQNSSSMDVIPQQSL